MEMHPLLVPHIVGLDPEIQTESLINGWIPSHKSHFGRFGTFLGEHNVTQISEIDRYRFREDGLEIDDSGHTEKIRQIMIGKGLDSYIDIPLAHRVIITGYDRKIVKFESIDENIPITRVPRHTGQSFQAMQLRKGLEVFKGIKLHWLSHRMIDHIGKDAFLDLGFESLIGRKGALGGVGSDFSIPQASMFAIPTDLGFPMLKVPQGYISNEKIKLDGEYPESILHALPGQSLKKVIDSEIFEGLIVTEAFIEEKSTIILFKSPEDEVTQSKDKTFADIFPDMIEEKLHEARKREENLIPASLAAYNEKLVELDNDRTTNPENHLLYVHLHRSDSGAFRKF